VKSLRNVGTYQGQRRFPSSASIVPSGFIERKNSKLRVASLRNKLPPGWSVIFAMSSAFYRFSVVRCSWSIVYGDEMRKGKRGFAGGTRIGVDERRTITDGTRETTHRCQPLGPASFGWMVPPVSYDSSSRREPLAFPHCSSRKNDGQQHARRKAI